MKTIKIVGSGISGLSIANLLNQKYDVEIYEKENSIGGLIKCERIEGHLFHKVGGHVFNSRNKDVLEWFWQFFDKDKEFIKTKRIAKIYINKNYIGYPIENHLYELKPKQIENIINDLIKINNQSNNKHDNFEDFLINNFGPTLYDIYFKPYNLKIWQSELKKIPLEWLDGKLPMPNINEIILSNILKIPESQMVHSSFYYPKENGSQFIINRLSEKIKITTNNPIKNIDINNNGKIKINDIKTDLIIYCGDVRNLNQIITTTDKELKNALNKIKDLKSNGTSNVLCETDEINLSWLYLPENKYKAHRIIYTGNFSTTNNNDNNNRKSCVVEFSGKISIDTINNELNQLPGNLKPISYNYEPNSYIIQDIETKNNISILKQILQKYNIYLLGRFAEWEYYNMDKCIESAMTIANQIHE